MVGLRMCDVEKSFKIISRVCKRLSTSGIEPPLTSCPTSNAFPLLTPFDRPPRPPPPPPSAATSARHLAGYNPARGDFASLPEPTLELLLSNLTVPESDLEEELQCTLVGAYNRRLKHRLRKLALVSFSFFLQIKLEHKSSGEGAGLADQKIASAASLASIFLLLLCDRSCPPGAGEHC